MHYVAAMLITFTSKTFLVSSDLISFLCLKPGQFLGSIGQKGTVLKPQIKSVALS